MTAHLHLDPVGGLAGDMFAAALLDLDPTLLAGLPAALRDAGLALDVDVALIEERDEVFVGKRFVVKDPREQGRPLPGRFVLTTTSPHPHVPWAGIKAGLENSALPAGARARALAIFSLLADAEAGVHGVAVSDIAFHEVGAQDSIADIVTAALLVERLAQKHGGLTVSCSSLPIGSGRVTTAHGELPVPAPATLRLLQGLTVHDDGRPGERVTPTGAAIIRHLVGGVPQTRRPSGVVGPVGTGFGTKRFSGMSNILRASLILPTSGLASTATSNAASTPTSVEDEPGWLRRELCVLRFEVDDQSPEDLAIGLDHLREVPGVLEVTTASLVGKKGRLTLRVEVLTELDAKDRAIRACLLETTTLGLRVSHVERVELARDEHTVQGVRVKRASRPGGGATQKADIDDIKDGDRATRQRRRQRAEEGPDG